MHELGYSECPKSFVFRGTKEYAPKAINEMLGLAPPPIRPGPGGPPANAPPPASFGAARFLLPVSQCEYGLTSILEQLQKDPWPVASDRRAQRCTGVAMSVAVGLLEVRVLLVWVVGRDKLMVFWVAQTSFPNTGARIMLFAGGPPTEGPGMVVGVELREPLRGHHDIERDNVKHFKRASKVTLLIHAYDLVADSYQFRSSTSRSRVAPRRTGTRSTSSQDASTRSACSR